MANLLQVPTTMIGLMGARPRQQNPMLGLMGEGGAPANGGQWGYVGGQDISPDRQLSPEEIDALFLTEQAQQASNGSGQWGYVGGQDIAPNRQLTPEEIDGLFLAADPSQMQNAQPVAPASATAQQAPQAPAGPARRGRVSGWRVLDRVLGGQTVSQGLDSERVRLQAEADAPAIRAQRERMARLAAAMGPQAELALALNGSEFGKAMASNLEGYTLTAGGVRGGANGVMAGAPTTSVVNDQIYQNDPMTRTSRLIATADPSFSDQTARFNAMNPVLAANSTWVGPDGNPRASGYIAPTVTSTPVGGTTNVLDAEGNLINTIQGNAPADKPLSASDQTAIDKADVNITRLGTSIDRAKQIQAQLTNGTLNLGPMANLVSGARNLTGNSSANSLNYDALLSWAKSARNAALSANTGVQTDQDAIRELDTILSGTRDERVVKAALGRYIELNEATQAAIQRGVDRRLGGSSASGGQNTAPALPPGFVLER